MGRAMQAGGAGASAPDSTRLGTAFRGFEEYRELVQALVAERREGRHLRARIDAGRTLEVVDLELDAEVPGADVRQIGRTEVRASGPVVRVTGRTARGGEERHPRLRCRGQMLVLDP